MHPGKPAVSMAQALQELYQENSSDPAKIILDRDMLKKLKDFFIK